MDNSNSSLLIFFIVLITLAVSYVIACEFRAIAKMKGYDSSESFIDSKYFWYCFLFGIAGHLLVIALPNKSNSNTEMIKGDNASDVPPSNPENISDVPPSYPENN